ncbi:MAG: SpoIIIAH-like family protein [Clostridia bacterium]|nr:SpoIIIAH-like family protein [Clostridia bacterium]
MKKGTILGKSQIILAVMVIALGAAVWFNVKYSSDSKNGNKYLGQAEYVGNTSGNAMQVGTETDYFVTAKKERDAARDETKADLQQTIKSAGSNTDAAAKAVDKASSIAARETAEQNIESLLKAKGFKKVLAIIGDNDINIVVKAASLTAQQTLQIQDIASSQSGYTADKIKILTVK